MTIDNDKVVSVEYELKDTQTNDILDSNLGKAPLEFMFGRGQIIPGLESELKGMSANEEKQVLVKAKDAYGEYDEAAKQTLPKEQFAGIELVEGMSLYGQGEDGQTVQVTVTGFTDSEVTVDFNHPLAGKDLLFDVKITNIREATEDELATGAVGGHACGTGGCGDSHSHQVDECCDGEHHKDGGSCCGAHH